MERMKTFLTYVLIIVLFYLFSNFATDVMFANSYRNVKNNVQIEQSDNGFQIEIDKANSNKQQAYFTGVVRNTSDKVIDKQYVRVDSYYKGRLMQSKYLAFENLQPGEERKFKLVYSVGNIDEFRVSYVDEIPVNRTLIDDAIDKIKEFTSNIMKKVGNVSIDGAADSIKNAFEPVHVEGNDFEIFVAVMWILYAIPPGAIWFIF